MTGEKKPKRAKKQDRPVKAQSKPEVEEVSDGVLRTPVRGLPTTPWTGQYFRLPLETPDLIKEGKVLAAARGVRVTNAQIVAEGVRLWVERERRRK
ncbi:MULTISPECIES: hypothetical protein [unclassified Microbacterium]|uniref:hypothetical protein n=1 Tax=unclassified Microbacterium TaxID=2609290 RepID=UPI0011AFE58F|nr:MULTISPECIES: hypothetical protein [unclassified Microbacterium]